MIPAGKGCPVDSSLCVFISSFKAFLLSPAFRGAVG